MSICDSSGFVLGQRKRRSGSVKCGLLSATALGLVFALGAPAKARAQECNAGTPAGSLECGPGATAGAEDGIAIGDGAVAGDDTGDDRQLGLF